MLTRQVRRHNWAIGCVVDTTRKAHHDKVPSTKDATEVDIKIPWGKIAGKLWGGQSKQPILALHGWQDNAASFDQLAPLLLDHGPILAIDLPGHGLSSWFSPGNLYYELSYVFMVRRIQRYFSWPKVKFLSHSLGAQLTLWYASLYPDETKFVVALDYPQFPSKRVQRYNKILANNMERFLDIEQQKTESPSYTEDVLIKKWMEATNGSVDETACRILMTRGVTRKPDGTYSPKRDPGLKALFLHNSFHHSYLEDLTALINCPYLFVKGEESALAESEQNMHNLVEIMRKHCKEVQYKSVPGSHHFHLCNPVDAAKAIRPFLEKYN